MPAPPLGPYIACVLQEAIEQLSHDSEDSMWVKLGGCHLVDGKMKKVCVVVGGGGGEARACPSVLLACAPCLLPCILYPPPPPQDCTRGVCSVADTLQLAASALVSPGLWQLAEALRSATAVISLDLSSNSISDEGAGR